jgi:transcriptional regulator GlxA family with amidase domain
LVQAIDQAATLIVVGHGAEGLCMKKKGSASGPSQSGSPRTTRIKPVRRGVEATAPEDPKFEGTMDFRVQTVIGVLTNGADPERPLDELARAVNLSTSRLRHLFKEQTGQTPSRFRRSVIIKKARTLLETTFLTIQEICDEVGASGYATFLRDFEQAFGVTPSQHRKSYFASHGGPRD